MTLYCDESDDGDLRPRALAGIATGWKGFDPAWRAMLQSSLRLSSCRAPDRLTAHVASLGLLKLSGRPEGVQFLVQSEPRPQRGVRK